MRLTLSVCIGASPFCSTREVVVVKDKGCLVRSGLWDWAVHPWTSYSVSLKFSSFVNCRYSWYLSHTVVVSIEHNTLSNWQMLDTWKALNKCQLLFSFISVNWNSLENSSKCTISEHIENMMTHPSPYLLPSPLGEGMGIMATDIFFLFRNIHDNAELK